MGRARPWWNKWFAGISTVEMKKLTKIDNIFVMTGNLLYVYFRAWKASDIKALDDFLCRNKDNR